MLTSLLEGKPGAVHHFRACRVIACVAFMALGVSFTPQIVQAQTCSNDADCDDGNPCTDDQCPCSFDCPAECWHISTCDDGQFCNGNELCCAIPGGCGGTPFGVCRPGEAVVCSGGQFCSNTLGTCVGCEFDAQCADNNDCTIESCNPSTHLCEQTNADLGSNCDDGDACTLNDTCVSGGICEGAELDCATSAPVCQFGRCVNGDCQFTPLSSGTCNDGDVCTAVSSCQDGQCVGGDANGCVNLELKLPFGAPAYNVGDVVEVELWAKANGCPAPPPQSTCTIGTQDVLSVQAIVGYDPAVLALANPSVIGSPNPEDPCNDIDPCNVDCGFANLYNWGSSLFPNTCGAGDPINEPCTGVPSPDGDFLYTSLAQITCNGGPAESACVSTAGLHVTTFKFVAVGATAGVSSSSPVVLEQCSLQSRTKITAGAVSGLDVLGDRLSASVDVGCSAGEQCPFGVCTDGVCSACPAPIVEAVGPRYVRVVPAPGPPEVALFVEGLDPDVACISGYLKSDGTLSLLTDLNPFETYLPPGPGGWDTVFAHDESMPGGMTYSIRADCDSANPGTTMSEAVTAKTWRAGDTDNNTSVDITDAVRGVDGFVGRYLIIATDGEPCLNDLDCATRRPHQSCDLPSGLCNWITIENVDTFGSATCQPNGQAEIVDILNTLQHFQGIPDECNPRCP